jgi:hypothetical protein
MSTAHLVLLGLLCVTPGQASKPVNLDAKTQKEFIDRVNKYLDLRNGLEAKLPSLPDKAEPKAITQNQKALLAAVRRARGAAQPGDLFTEDIRHLIRRLIAGALAHEGSAPRQAMREENPGTMPVRVNGEFPTSIPLPTVPPQVLVALPRLPDQALEYRFIGTRLLLLDSRANMVVDYMDHAVRK